MSYMFSWVYKGEVVPVLDFGEYNWYIYIKYTHES